MSDIESGDFAKIALGPGDSYRVTTSGVATVQGLSGAPAGTTTVTASSQTFGPYHVNAVLKVSAVSGTCSVVIQQDLPMVFNPSTQTVTDTAARTAIAEAAGGGVPILRNASATAALPARLALAKALQGVAPMKVLVIGNSTTIGSGSNGVPSYGNTRLNSWPVQLADKLRAIGIPAMAETQISAGALSNYENHDPRIVSVGWLPATALTNVAGGVWRSITDGATLTHTPNRPWKSAKIYYARSTTQGTFTATADGTTTAITATNGSNALGTTTITRSAAGLGSLTLTKTGTSGVSIIGVEFGNADDVGIEISVFAGSGLRSTDFNYATNAWDTLNVIQAIAPHLTIIDLPINDWVLGTAIGDTSTAGSFVDNYESIIAACLVSGSVLLFTGMPSNTPGSASYPSYATQQTYVDAIVARASAQGCLIVDTWRGLGSTWQTLFMTDDLHGNQYGYGDLAQRAVNEFLSLG